MGGLSFRVTKEDRAGMKGWPFFVCLGSIASLPRPTPQVRSCFKSGDKADITGLRIRANNGRRDCSLKPACWSYLGRSHRLRHPEEDHDTLSATPGRECFVGNAEAAIYILPIIHDPNVARRSDGKIGLHLQTSADVATRWRDLVAGLEARWTVLRTHAA
jgi:hypothetical protein